MNRKQRRWDAKAMRKAGKLARATGPARVGDAFEAAKALKRARKFREAEALYGRILEVEPDNWEAHNDLGVALKRQGKLDEAIASHQKAIALNPDYAKAHNSLGVALKGQGKLDEAKACFRRAFEIEPGFFAAHLNHSAVHKFFPGEPEIEKLQELLELKDIPEARRIRILFALGKAHDDIGRYAEAFSYYSTANAEMARQAVFNPSHHRRTIMAIKDVFRKRLGSAGETFGDAEHVPIFVLGMSRSGKTLVESLLSQHQDAYGAGERNDDWPNAMEAVLDKYSISQSFPNCMGFLSDDHIREMGKIYMGSLIKDSLNAKLLINTAPDTYRFVGMILQALPMAKILHCHRDPADNCLFAYFRKYVLRNEYSYDLSHVASFYADYQDMMAHWRRLYGDSIYRVRYEELVRTPLETGARIYEFCGLHYDPGAVRHAFTTDQIGHWKHYEPYLDALRQALGGLAQ